MKTVTVDKIFYQQEVAGLPYGDWLALSKADQLIARLSFLQDRAKAIHSQPYDIASGLPANLWEMAQRLDAKVNEVFSSLSGDFVGGYGLMLDIGMLVQQIQDMPALFTALKTWTFEVTDRCSKGGQATAEARKKEKQERKEKVITKYYSLADRPERDRAGIISESLGIPAQKVRQYLREHRKANGR